MFTSMVKNMLTSLLAADGQKQIDRDPDNVGSDDVRGHIEKGVASALDAIDLSTLKTDSLHNAAEAFRACADEIDKQASILKQSA